MAITFVSLSLYFTKSDTKYIGTIKCYSLSLNKSPFLNLIWMLCFSHLKIADFESLKMKIKGTRPGDSRCPRFRTCPTTSIWLQVYDTLFYDLIKSV